MKKHNSVRDYCLRQNALMLKDGKSPVSDRFTFDFYKVFWIDIKNQIIDSLNYAFITRVNFQLKIDVKSFVLFQRKKR